MCHSMTHNLDRSPEKCLNYGIGQPCLPSSPICGSAYQGYTTKQHSTPHVWKKLVDSSKELQSHV